MGDNCSSSTDCNSGNCLSDVCSGTIIFKIIINYNQNNYLIDLITFHFKIQKLILEEVIVNRILIAQVAIALTEYVHVFFK